MTYISRFTQKIVPLSALIFSVFILGCNTNNNTNSNDSGAFEVVATTPASGANDVPVNRGISVSLSADIEADTVSATTFTLVRGTTPISGTLSVTGTTATFNPAADLQTNAVHTATLTSGIKDMTGNSLNSHVFSFTTGDSAADGPAPVILGKAGEFVVLAKTAITTTDGSDILGDMGISPAALSDVAGFGPTLDSTGQFATSSMVTGKIFASDMGGPTETKLTTAVSNMETAYTDAAGRSDSRVINLGGGEIGSLDIPAGLYNWDSGVKISTDLALTGDADAVWIFQVSGELTVASGVKVTLSGGALPENIFWQVADNVVLGTTSAFNGIILGKTQVAVETGATLNGRALAQTQVTLDSNDVIQPAQ